MTLCFLRGSLRCEGDREVQILIDVVKKTKIQRRFWHGRSCVVRNNSIKRKKFGAFNTRNIFARVAKILYRCSSRKWTAIKNLQRNYLKGRILLQANNKLLVSPLQLLSGSIIILSPAFKVCIQDSILHNNYGDVFEQLARYTMRYQESNLPLGLYSPLTSANNRILNLLTLFLYSILTLLFLS